MISDGIERKYRISYDILNFETFKYELSADFFLHFSINICLVKFT